MPAVRPILW